jgi:hypothetical protein
MKPIEQMNKNPFTRGKASQEEHRTMQYVGKSEISRARANPKMSYPLIRLPQSYNSAIGKIAYFFRVTFSDSDALLTVFDSSTETCDFIAQKLCDLQRDEYVSSFDQRFSVIESQIAELKSLIFQGGSEFNTDRENQRPRARFEPASWPPQGRFLNINRRMSLLVRAQKSRNRRHPTSDITNP